MRKLFVGVLAVVLGVVLYACSGGGGSAAGPTKYQAGLSIGDLGTLTIDTTQSPITYSLQITSSSYGLTGTSYNGQLTDNGDGTYNVVGSNYAKVFNYSCYSVVPIPINSPQVNNTTVYVPVFGLKDSCLMSTVDQITSNGQVTNFRDIHYGFTKQNGTAVYVAYGANGVITKISDTSFSVASCSNYDSSINSGNSAKNSQIQNCTASTPTYAVTTYTYDATKGGWVVQQSAGSTTQVIAYFVSDSDGVSNQVLGFVDASDSTGNSAGFDVISVSNSANVNTTISGTANYISYQLCASLNNCAQTNDGEYGIYTTTMTVQTGGANPSVSTDNNGCTTTNTSDDPIVGFGTNIHTGNCNSSPDNISFLIGQSSKGGKTRGLIPAAGFDISQPNANKFSIGTIELQ